MATRSWCLNCCRRLLPLGALAVVSCSLLHAQYPNRLGNDTEGTVFAPGLQWSLSFEPGELQTSVRLREAFDGRAVAGEGQVQPGTYTYPEVEWTYGERRPRQLWAVSYRFGGRVYDPILSSLDTTLSDMRFRALQEFSPRLKLSLLQRWASLPTNGFEQAESGTPESPFPPLTAPDQNVLFLARQERVFDSGLALTYQWNRRTSLVWGGAFDDTKYQPDSLLHSRAENAYFFIDRTLTQQQNFGFGYSSLWLEYPGQATGSRIDYFIGQYSNALTPTLSLAAFGGVAVIHQLLGGQPTTGLTQVKKGAVGGVAIGKKLGRNQLQWRYNQLYARGDALMGTVFRQTALFLFNRSLSRRLAVDFRTSYTCDQLQQTSSCKERFYEFLPSLRYQLGQRATLTISEGYVGTTTRSVFGYFTRNLFMIELEYHLPNWAVER